MKANLAVLLFLLSTLALAGIIPGFRSTPNPNDIFKKVQFLPLYPLDYAGKIQIIQSPKFRLN